MIFEDIARFKKYTTKSKFLSQTEDLAAEQKARATYENLICLADDPDVLEPLKFLREREIVHFQRFGEALRIVQDSLAEKKYYAQKPLYENNKAY